jgi:peptidoglycan/xylan/chitin deacetylase (PgdA/CDA1 family)
MIRLTFRVDSVTNLNYILLYVGSSAFANYFTFPVHTHSATAQNIVQSGEWVTLTIPWANVQTAAGSYSISSGAVPSAQSGFTCMQVSLFDNGSGPVTMHLQAVEVIPDTVTTFPGGVVSVVFDDSYEDVFTYARPVMDTYGYRGTAYTIAQNIGAGGSLTLAQLQQMQDISGWEVAGHAYTLAAHNAGYDTLTALQVQDEMRYLRSWMLNGGFPLDNFAYPLGNFASTTDGVPIDQICSQFFSTGRSIVAETYETFPPPMPYRVRSQSAISSAGTPVSVITAAGHALDRCANDGSWYVITLHDVIPGTATVNTQISQSDFSTLIAAVNSRGIPVLPVGDVIGNYS